MSICSEASVKVAIEVLANDRDKKRWMHHSLFNLSWNDKDNNLTHCGKNGINSFDILLTCPFLNCHIVNEKIEDIKTCLTDGYVLILPISTEKIGIPGKNFFHNIYANAMIKDDIISIFDFWAPGFVWKEKQWEIQKLVNGVVKNVAEHIYPVACKVNSVDQKYISCFDVKEMLDSFICGCNGIGIDAYNGISNWIINMESPYMLNHVVFVTLEEHIKIMEKVFEEYTGENVFFDEIKKKIFALRNLSIKLWYSEKTTPNWRNEVLRRLTEIQRLEKEYYLKIKNEKGVIK